MSEPVNSTDQSRDHARIAHIFLCGLEEKDMKYYIIDGGAERSIVDLSALGVTGSSIGEVARNPV
ncbi:hypothetical protein, partial [Falsiroseomonas sp. CW058]|uniref:hypothetical protein n=1 Tax=Falsiroseomonas sp. CW058 TaxID=3388664 RepID=UPI003D321CA3